MESPKDVFEPVVIESVAEAVATQIETLILSGVLKSGQKLPSEQRLADSMKVSRPSVRDAAKILEERGLLEIKHGGGTFIAGLSGPALSPALLGLYKRHASAYRDYVEYRHAVEGVAAYLAAKRATESDKEIIKLQLAQMEEEFDKNDYVREPQLDAAFHSAIVEAAHNSVFSHTMSSVYMVLSSGVFYNRVFLEREPQARARLLEQHKEIANAVFEGAADDAAAAAEAHVEYVMTWHQFGAADELRGRTAAKRLLLLEQSRDPAIGIGTLKSRRRKKPAESASGTK